MEGRHKEATDAQSAVATGLGAHKSELASLEQAAALVGARIQDLEGQLQAARQEDTNVKVRLQNIRQTLA